jgi:hypothetical protein
VDFERQLVEILVEQQKAVLGMIEQGRVADERYALLVYCILFYF